jgi:hypothetical protein
MKHHLDWSRGELSFTYQSRYVKHRAVVPLPKAIIKEMSRSYGEFSSIPARYAIRTDLAWDPVHRFYGSRMSPGIRIAKSTKAFCELELYVQPHGPTTLTIYFSRHEIARHNR